MIAAFLVALLFAIQAPAAPPKPAFTLRVAAIDGFSQLSLTSEGAKLSDIAADLAKRLQTRVVVGPSIQEDPVTVKFTDSALEPALTALAARVTIDYEIRYGAQPAPQGIYLLGINDPEPASDAVVKGVSMGLMITGHTEEPTEPAGGDPLKVIGSRKSMSIVSKQQPLALVLQAISEVLGVPFEIKTGGDELVDVNLVEVSPEDALMRLSANMRLYVRVNVNRFERMLLRYVVAPPPAKQDR